MHLKLTDKHSDIELLIPVNAIYVEASPGKPVRIGILGRAGSLKRAGEVEIQEPLMMEVKETLPQILRMLDFAKGYRAPDGSISVEDVEEEEPDLDGLDIGSVWAHDSGKLYKITALTNTMNRNVRYPVQVVYENTHNGTVWSRNARDWHRSFTRVNEAQ